MTVYDSRMMTVMSELSEDSPDNCICDMVERVAGRIMVVEGTLNANNTSAVMNVFKINGTVEIIDAYGKVTDNTVLNNLTNCYFDLYDGTNAVNITADGATLSGADVGTMILKTLDASSAATVVLNDQCRVTEADTSKRTHHPFICTAKGGADTYIRCHYTTTDAPINAKIKFYVVYNPKDGGSVEVA